MKLLCGLHLSDLKIITMKQYFIYLAALVILASTNTAFSQSNYQTTGEESFKIESVVTFSYYEDPYGEENHIKEPVINFILKITNTGDHPVPDLCVTNRSEFLNFYVNDSIQNPISMYNGIEVNGEHLLYKNESDSYTWWVFTKDSYGDIFTVKWQYMGVFSENLKVDVKRKTVYQTD